MTKLRWNLLTLAMVVSVTSILLVIVSGDKSAIAGGTTQCSCPAVKCDTGSLQECSARCEAPQQAECDCGGACNGPNTSGQNSCRCS